MPGFLEGLLTQLQQHNVKMRRHFRGGCEVVMQHRLEHKSVWVKPKSDMTKDRNILA
jgi:hypothetical protein